MNPEQLSLLWRRFIALKIKKIGALDCNFPFIAPYLKPIYKLSVFLCSLGLPLKYPQLQSLFL